jgi:hypothetical protein
MVKIEKKMNNDKYFETEAVLFREPRKGYSYCIRWQLVYAQNISDSRRHPALTACSVGWWLMAGAGLF